MYNTDIQTTVSIRGHLLFLEYRVTEEWAVEWWLNPGCYFQQAQNGQVNEEINTGLNMLDTLLRTHESAHIEHTLLTEFESRQYAQEQADIALGANLDNEDVPF